MRTSLRVALGCLVAFTIASIISLYTVRDRVREHLHDIYHYQPSFQWASQGNREGDRLYSALEEDDKPPPTDPLPISQPDDDEPPRPPNDYTTVHLSYKPPAQAIVMARLSSEDTAWVSELHNWTAYVYTVDSAESRLHTPRNKGREAMAYLTYIIENYERLAETVAFIHSHKDGWPQSWHTDDLQYNNVNTLNNLNIDYVQEQGYVNLRCITEIGCPAEVQPYRGIYGSTTADVEKEVVESMFQETWPLFFAGYDRAPETIAAACCAQFAVSDAQIRKRTLENYVEIRNWLLEVNITDAAAGRVMEYSWHTMFGKDPVFCPDVETCWCKVYGQCLDVVGLGKEMFGGG